MTNKQEALIRLTALEAEAAALHKALEAPEVKGRWRARYSDVYYYFDGYSDMRECETHHELDEAHYTHGNYFQTEEQSAARAKWMRLHTMLWDFSRRDGWEPDWSKETLRTIAWDNDEDEPTTVIWQFSISSNAIYFRTEADAQEAIRMLGDDAKCYLTYSWF